MNIEGAKDYIDTYGSDRRRWTINVADMDDMIANNSEVAAYLSNAKRIDDMLSDWKESEDGADVQDSASGQDEDEDDAPTPVNDEVINFDPDVTQDLDEMLSNFIRENIQKDSNGDTFTVFTRDYDETVEIIPHANTDVSNIDKAVAAASGALQKDLRRLIAARTQAKRVPGKRAGRLHGPNLHRIMSGDDRVFYRREEAPEIDTAISLVLDCSASMRGSRMKLATEASYAIGSVLNKLGVAFESLGFTDNTEDPRVHTKEYQRELAETHQITPVSRSYPLIMPKFKSFDERWNGTVQRRFAHVYSTGSGFNYGYTPEGCGIEFAARRLLRRPEKRKLMIVMTDGEAAGPVYYGGGHGQGRGILGQRSKDVVQSVLAAGVDIVGVGIQRAGVTDTYPSHIVIRDLADMPAQLLAVLKKFIVK